MYERILLPVDQSTESTDLLHQAAELAHWADAEVEVLYVADSSRDSVTLTDGNVVDALVEGGETVVEAAGEVLDSLGVEYGTDVVQGVPAQTIVDYADRYEYDLIAMPTHAREGLSRYLLGSVTEKVVRLSPVPVLTTHSEQERAAFPFDRLLIPTDGSDVAFQAAEHGLEFAAALDAEVHVLSASVGPMLADLSGPVGTDSGQEPAESAVNAVVEAAAEYDVDTVVSHVVEGTADGAIIDAVDEEPIDAVVMGTTGRQGVDRVLLGSVAEKTVRSAPVPVITVGEDISSS